MIDEGNATGVTSELTLAEVLVKPLRDKNMLVAQVYEALLAGSNKLTVVPISREILRLSAHVRAVARANRLFDSIHVATAMQSGCHAFVTEDDRIRTIDDLPIVLVRDMPSHG